MAKEVAEVTYRMIVVATDGSSVATEAAKHAVALARKYDASLRAIYVINTHIAFHLGAYQQLALESLQEEGDQAVASIVKLAQDSGVNDVSGTILSGSPREQIVDWVETEGADLLVIGSHGYSKIGALLIGSVAEYVVRHSPCPVLVVRRPGKD